MSSPYSTITSNVTLLLLDTYTITSSNNPYIAYVSSVSVPGKIATIRDATGNLVNYNKIIVSTTNDVYFNDGTNRIDITQPFGYVSLSSRDKNTWNVINTYAFPDPYGVTMISSLFVRDNLTVPNIYTNNIFGNGVSADVVMNTNLDMYNYTIFGLGQTDQINYAATNDIISKYSLITSNNTSNIGTAISGFTVMTASDTPFTLNTVFTKYKFTFYFKGETSSNAISNTFFFCCLSNNTTGQLYSGSNVGSNPLGGFAYPLVVPKSLLGGNPTITTFQYTDVFSTNYVVDSLSVLLYGYSDCNVFTYSAVNFYMTYEPVLS